MNIEFLSYIPSTGCSIFESLIACYCDVFADAPWNEWMLCSECGKYWGKNDQEQLMVSDFVHCGQKLKPFWPHETVAQDLLHEIDAKASCWIAQRDQNVIGFCWGYPIKLSTLEEKLRLPFLAELQDTLGVSEETVAYVDDIGVLSEYRGHKIAKKLFQHLNKDFTAKGFNTIVARTRELPEPSVTYNWFVEKLGYKVVKRYPKIDGRVILAQKS